MKSTEDILKEIEAAAAIPLPEGCAYDDGFEDFLHGIRKEKKIMNNWTTETVRWIKVTRVISGDRHVGCYIPVSRDILVTEMPDENGGCNITYVNAFREYSIRVVESMEHVMDLIVGE